MAKSPPGVWLAGEVARDAPIDCRRDVKRVEILAAELAAGRQIGGHIDRPDKFARRVVGQNLPFERDGQPVVSLSIDRRAVDDVVLGGKVDEDPAIGDLAARRIEIIRPDEVGVAVGEIERLVVGTPGEPIRAADVINDLVDREVGVEPP